MKYFDSLVDRTQRGTLPFSWSSLFACRSNLSPPLLGFPASSLHRTRATYNNSILTALHETGANNLPSLPTFVFPLHTPPHLACSCLLCTRHACLFPDIPIPPLLCPSPPLVSTTCHAPVCVQRVCLGKHQRIQHTCEPVVHRRDVPGRGSDGHCRCHNRAPLGERSIDRSSEMNSGTEREQMQVV